MTTGLIIIAALVLILVGMPVAFAIGISGTAYFLLPSVFLPDSTAVQRIAAASQSFPLLAVPLFILLGNLMNRAGITPRLVDLAMTLAGWMRGGLAQSTLILSALMGGISGSAVADAAVQARILGKPMEEQGYDKGFTGVLLSVGGLITATLPPSLGLILYGYLGEVSIGRLFIAGIVPGAMLTVCLIGSHLPLPVSRIDHMPCRCIGCDIIVSLTNLKRTRSPYFRRMGAASSIFTPLMDQM